MQSACSTGSEAVTQTVMRVLKRGGNAADAVIAGALVEAAVEPHLASLAGTLLMLYHDGTTGTTHALDASGTLPADLPPCRTVPAHAGGHAAFGKGPVACIPGFMPGLKAIHDRFGTLDWPFLCEDAIEWAETGHVVTAFEFEMQMWGFNFLNYFEEGRELFVPEGFLRGAGTQFRNAKLAETLRRCAIEGPEDCISGEWARAFVAAGNRLGWPVTLKHLRAAPPNWQEPLCFSHGEHCLIHLPPPQRQGILCALVLGMLQEAQIDRLPVGSAEHCYLMAHVLRTASQLCSYVNDPQVFAVPVQVMLDPAFQRYLARIIVNSCPKVDMTNHVVQTAASTLSGGTHGSRFDGPPLEWQVHGEAMGTIPTSGRDIAVVDARGNWAQLMCTLQSGGIPGMVVGGVAMIGSHATHGSLISPLDGWLAPGARLRGGVGSTFVVRDGAPIMSLGNAGPIVTALPQVLSRILDQGLDPIAAIDAPRMRALTGGYELAIEGRQVGATAQQLAKLGIKLTNLPAYERHMGVFQACWRDNARTQLINACTDPRHRGYADGFGSDQEEVLQS
jgi:gamma-glutamyltranspeptidase/glutathione hydrolase